MKKKYYIVILFIITPLLLLIPLHGQLARYKIVQYDTLGAIQNVTFSESTYDQPENVLVLYNINYQKDENDNNIWDGYEIAAYYQGKRNIPSSNIVGIRAPTSPTITQAQYDSYFDEEESELGIRQQVESILNTHVDSVGNLLRGKIKYIVLTKGIPHRIAPLNSTEYKLADFRSVDNALCMVFNGNYDIAWRIENPYYRQDPSLLGTSPFIPEFYTNPSGLRLSYLVTRLDGYSVDDVFKMINKGVQADSTDRYHTFVLDDAQKTVDNMLEGFNRLKLQGANVYPDPWQDSPDPIFSIADSVIGIVTHGIHAGYSPDYILNNFSFNLANGAIFTSYESLNGVSFSTDVQVGMGQVADFIRIGGSGGVGNVYEPWSRSIADEWILFPAYFAGYTFAEAAYMSLISMDWVSVVVGDPLMRIGPAIQVESATFRMIEQQPGLLADDQSENVVAQIMFSKEIDTLNVPSFYYLPGSLPLKIYVDKNYIYLWSDTPFPVDTRIGFQTDDHIYSISGDSLGIVTYADFWTHPMGTDPVAPKVYRVDPSGIDVDQKQDIILFFSDKMQPATIFPLQSNHNFIQQHNWLDGRILQIVHPPFLPATFYSFNIDEHAKSEDNMSLEQAFLFNFQTLSNYIVHDIDNDGFPEYAHNFNESLLDGYETYADSGGVVTSVLDIYDINSDNQNEFFIRKQVDDFPSYYWNPNAIPYTGYLAQCFPIDDDEDNNLEYAFDAIGKGYFTSVYDPDETPKVRDINFILTKSLPSNLQTNVNPTTEIVLDFSIPVKYTGLDTNLVFEPKLNIQSIQTDINGSRIIIHPADTLKRFTNYQLTVKKGLFSLTNNNLAHEYIIDFQTGDLQSVVAPQVVSFYPGDSLQLIDNTPTVRFIFSSPMNTAMSFPVTTDTTTGIFWTSFWSDNRTLFLIPQNELEESAFYEFTVSSLLTSKNGVALGGKKVFNFISGIKSEDTRSPNILQILPIPASTIANNTSISIIFSEWIESNPSEYISIEGNHSYTLAGLGRNLLTISGNPAWIPQSELKIVLNPDQLHDNNNNVLLQNYELVYYILGSVVSRDVDNDGVLELAIDSNDDLSDGQEFYFDPGGEITQAIFSGNIDGDSYFDFIISNEAGTEYVTWFPSRADSGIIGYTEQLSDSTFEISIDSDDLVEFEVDIIARTVLSATPKIRSTIPANASDGIYPFTPLVLQFNTRMDAFSVIQSFEISPAISGKWTESNKTSKMVFIPLEGWASSTIYTIHILETYQALNGTPGKEPFSFSFRTTDDSQEIGGISWQFPQMGDSAHSNSFYYFAFSSKVDTSIKPFFSITKNAQSNALITKWISDTLLQISPPPDLGYGQAALKGSGLIRFLNAPQLQLESNTPFIVNDSLKLRLVKPLFTDRSIIPVNKQFVLIFNQALNSSSYNQIKFNHLTAEDSIQLSQSIFSDYNYVSITPHGLEYSNDYNLVLNPGLKGVSENVLSQKRVFNFRTMDKFSVEQTELFWQQFDNFLTLNFPETGIDSYELYLMNAYNELPDTSQKQNLYNLTQVPAWLFNLGNLPQKSYISFRLITNDVKYWRGPYLVQNIGSDKGDNLSLPITISFQPDSIHKRQGNFQTLSQWDNSITGWRSSKYLEDVDKWSNKITIEKTRGMLARTNYSGQIAWVQPIPDTLKISESSFVEKQYHSLYNPFTLKKASELSLLFGNSTRLAFWDNSEQGWNEAVFDTLAQGWVNDFNVPHLTPVYVYTQNSFSIPFDAENQIVINSNSKSSPTNDLKATSFPSSTHIIHFTATVHRMDVYREGELLLNKIGCGIDTTLNVGFINVGNLESENDWLFEFYDVQGKLISSYRKGSGSNLFSEIPTSFTVGFAYPNPFNPTVSIPITVPETGELKIRIFNILGQLVHKQDITFAQPRVYYYVWNSAAHGTSSGIYFIQVAFKSRQFIRKVLFLK